MAGPGTHDILFNNKIGVVVPAGVVDRILKVVKPIMKYKRKGGLYVAEMELSALDNTGFTRPEKNP